MDEDLGAEVSTALIGDLGKLIRMGDQNWLVSWAAWAVFLPRVTAYSYGRARVCFSPPWCLVWSWGLGFGLLRGARSGDWGRNQALLGATFGFGARAEPIGNARAGVD